jgi:hypothetical protein
VEFPPTRSVTPTRHFMTGTRPEPSATLTFIRHRRTFPFIADLQRRRAR